MNTEQLDTILEEEVLKSAEEVCKIVDMPGRRQLEENEAELMKRSTVDQLKDEVAGDIGEHSEEGRVNFGEECNELLTCTPLLQEFKSGLWATHLGS